MSTAPDLLPTPRLLLRAPDEALTDAVSDFRHRNAAHFAPWDPPLPPDHADPAVVRASLAEGRIAFEAGTACRWWLLPRDGPERVIGSVHLSQVARGAFQNAMLGYALDAQAQGRGLMHEALAAVLDIAFAPLAANGLNLHRIQAGVRPENARSLAVLARLGFVQEGLARQYLYIDDAWRDHLIFARINPAFQAPPHWPAPTAAQDSPALSRAP